MGWVVYGITLFVMVIFVCFLIDDIKELVDMEREKSEKDVLD